MLSLVAVFQWFLAILPIIIFICSKPKKPGAPPQPTQATNPKNTQAKKKKTSTLVSKSQSIPYSVDEEPDVSGKKQSPTSLEVMQTQDEEKKAAENQNKDTESEAKKKDDEGSDAEKPAKSSRKIKSPKSLKVRVGKKVAKSVKKEDKDKTEDEADNAKDTVATTQADEEKVQKKEKREPKLPLFVDLAKVAWTDTGGQKQIKLTNNSGTLYAVKFKCSDNKMFIISPVFSMLQPGQTILVTITRSPGPLKPDKVVICWTSCLPADKDLPIFFKKTNLSLDSIDIAQVAQEKSILVRV